METKLESQVQIPSKPFTAITNNLKKKKNHKDKTIIKIVNALKL